MVMAVSAYAVDFSISGQVNRAALYGDDGESAKGSTAFKEFQEYRQWQKSAKDSADYKEFQDYRRWKKSGRRAADYNEFQEWREFKAYQEWRKSQNQ